MFAIRIPFTAYRIIFYKDTQDFHCVACAIDHHQNQLRNIFDEGYDTAMHEVSKRLDIL